MDWQEYCFSLFEKCKKQETPFSACFELTPFCNFRCNMCYIRLTQAQAEQQGSLLSTTQWIKIAEESKKMGTIALEVTGGEPTYRNDFPTLYESFIKMGFIINLRSNGYLLDGDIFTLLKKYKPYRIGITLYGASNDTYKKVCGVSDGFSVVTKNILALRDEGFNLRLTMTITKDNHDDFIHLKQWAEENSLIIHPYGGLFTPIRGAKRSIEHLKYKHFIHDIDKYDDYNPPKRFVADRSSYMKPFWLCRGFGAMYTISWDGRMTICNSMPAIWKDPFANGLYDAYKSLYRELNSLERPEECKTCQYIDFCNACPSRLYSATGRPDCTNEDICNLTKHYYKIYQKRVDDSQIEKKGLDINCEGGNPFEN